MINLTITKPGIYDLPISAYHEQICDAPSYSHSELWLLRSKSPAHFWAQRPENPKALIEQRTPAMDFGAAAHSLLLEGTLPESEYVLAPFGGNYASGSHGYKRDEKRAWRDAQIEAGKIIVTPDELTQIADMGEALYRHPLIKDGLFSGAVERSCFWKDEGLWLKARPDVQSADTILADYKAVKRADAQSVAKSIEAYGYHMQIAMQIDGLFATSSQKIETACLVCQEKDPPYCVAVYPLDQELIAAGQFEYKAAVRQLKECLDRSEWPAYQDTTIFLSDYRRIKLQAEGWKS